MPDDIEYHEARAAQERAMAGSCPAGEVRMRHLELAEQHERKARLSRGGLGHQPLESADSAVRAALARSHVLIDNSHRVLAETRSAVEVRS